MSAADLFVLAWAVGAVVLGTVAVVTRQWADDWHEDNHNDRGQR